jgi:hypothetical protein
MSTCIVCGVPITKGRVCSDVCYVAQEPVNLEHETDDKDPDEEYDEDDDEEE